MTVATSVFAVQLVRVAHREREDGHDPVAVDVAPGRVDGQAAVGVAVVRDAEVGAVLDDRPAHEAEVRRADPVVDVEPVGLGRDRDDFGARPAVDLRGDGRRGTVRAVDHHTQPVEGAGRGEQQMVDVSVVGVVGQVADPADARPGRAVRLRRRAGPRPRASTASGSLCPPAAKSLMPLSGMALCDAEIITPRSASRARTRYATAGVGSTPTRSASAPAAVSPATTAASSISPLARGSRPTTATGRCDRSCSARTCAADAASATASSGVRTSPLASPRTPSVPNRRRAPMVTACCTEVPCGPSSGRTSCAR